MYNVEIYKDKNGKSDIREYLHVLQQKKDKSSRIKFNKIVSYIRMLSTHGTNLGIKYIKHINDNIWELRPLKDRILFAYWDNDTFILLNIFTKQTQKTPRLEIDKAKRLLEDFIRRSKNYER